MPLFLTTLFLCCNFYFPHVCVYVSFSFAINVSMQGHIELAFLADRADILNAMDMVNNGL